MVQSGELYGTVEQFPGQQARTGLTVLNDFITKGAKPEKHDIFIAPKLITQDNLDEAERGAEAGISPQPPAAKPAGQLNIAFSVPGLKFPFFVHMEKQVRDEATKLGIEIVTLDGQDQTTKQIADLEAIIAKKVRRHHHQPAHGRRHGPCHPGSRRRRHPGRDHRPQRHRRERPWATSAQTT